MKNRAIGMVEYQTVSTGITATDLMIKTADVEILQSTVICPGKYITLIGGELSAIAAAIEAAKVQFGEKLTDSFVLGNPHQDIFPAIYGGAPVEDAKALGILETFSTPAIINAADVAAKTSDVSLLELRIARGMGGKCFVTLTGNVADVQAAVEAGAAIAEREGVLINKEVIANPHPDLWQAIM